MAGVVVEPLDVFGVVPGDFAADVGGDAATVAQHADDGVPDAVEAFGRECAPADAAVFFGAGDAEAVCARECRRRRPPWGAWRALALVVATSKPYRFVLTHATLAGGNRSFIALDDGDGKSFFGTASKKSRE